MESFTIGNVPVGKGAPLLFIGGPCVIEDIEICLETAAALKQAAAACGMGYCFKASFDKANRTSLTSYRGPGMSRGLEILARVREDISVPVISDIHTPDQAETAAKVLDILQIPAFLCRQTDLLVAAAKTQKPVNIKKGQFLAPWDMEHAVNKVRQAGNERILLTERGTMLGYNNLVVDFRGLEIMRNLGCPVVFDATHSVQMPGGKGSCSGGDRRQAPVLARAAVAAGVDAIFFEVHPDPDNARCDGPNSLALKDVPDLLKVLAAVHAAVKEA
jgi:2-dehydro-3-deoxyphosphooctonate aldolase (KDO 8-P synthase)